MSKKAVPDNIMDDLLGTTGKALKGPAKAPQQARTRPAQAPDRPRSGPLKQCKLWLQAEDWEALAAHFKATGIPTSTGIRAWILERMKQEEIRG